MVLNIAKMTKAQLIDYIEGLEETRFENFKLQLGLPYDDEPEWIAYIKKLQELNAERLKDVEELTALIKTQGVQLKAFVSYQENSGHR
tara:strand:+ start:196 stop:459 length:264 start_codon:yes stop_codon:yes gene_type:complete